MEQSYGFVPEIGRRFHPSTTDPCIYVKKIEEEVIVVAVYVDDIITAGKETSNCLTFRKQMQSHFGMDEGGLLHWYLGLRFTKQEDGSRTST
jgi:hypothetical protein